MVYSLKNISKDRVLKVDGAHIATLWLTFFYRFMPELIKQGHIYISMPPLYKFTHGKKTLYVKTTEELNKLTKGKTNYNVQRFKGLIASPLIQ